MKIQYRKRTLLEEIDQIIKGDINNDKVDYIELSDEEMEEFLYTLHETGLAYEKHAGFDEMYYTYRGVRIYEQR